MLDSVAALRTKPLIAYALPQTIETLKKHIFNDAIWPDFTRIPSADKPFLSFSPIEHGQVLDIAGLSVEVLSAVHTVPACGYAITNGGKSWVFTGDTERNPAFWQRINQLDVGMLVIETAFSDRERDLAKRALHLSPAALADELDWIDAGKRFPIYITHTKPAETDLIMAEIQRFDDTDVFASGVKHDIRWLRAGQQLEI
jgi:ribonuclease BN (tRNA processing enzyme)